MATKKQAKPQATNRRLAPPSPRNGNQLPLLGPGETNNPGGCSAKVRQRAALNKLIDECRAEKDLRRIHAIIDEGDDGDAIAAFNALAKATGLYSEDVKVEVSGYVHVVELQPRGAPVPIPIPKAAP